MAINSATATRRSRGMKLRSPETSRWWRAVRVHLWWWRSARLYLSIFVLLLGAAQLVDWPWETAVLDLTP
jgi:hypothetical protein